MPTETRQLVQLAIHVDDLARSLAFYRDTLGLNLLFSAPNMALLDGGVRILLGDRGAAASSVIPFFASLAIEADYAQGIAGGAAAHTAPHRVAVHAGKEIWIAHLTDPGGNLISLLEERTPAQ